MIRFNDSRYILTILSKSSSSLIMASTLSLISSSTSQRFSSRIMSTSWRWVLLPVSSLSRQVAKN